MNTTRTEELTVVPTYENICAAAHCLNTTIRSILSLAPGETLDAYPTNTLHVEITCHAPSSPEFYTTTGLWNSYTINGTPVGNQSGVMSHFMQMVINAVVHNVTSDAQHNVTAQRPEMSVITIPAR